MLLRFDWLFRKKVREAQPEEDRGWRAVLTGPGGTWLGGSERDLTNWESLLREAYDFYTTNPLAYAIVEQSTNFVLGGGARVVAEEPRVQRVIDRFWSDPENRMDERIYAIQTELSLFGEQFIRFFIDPITGRTVIRQLDPLYVKAIHTDAQDVEKPLAYLWCPPSISPDPVLPAGAALAGDRGAPSTGTGGAWLPAGEVMHFTVNRVSNAVRGRSDLAPILPWLRRYREWLEDRARQNRYKGAFLWDVTVRGASSGELDRLRAMYASVPESGTVLFHNDGEEWKAVQPQIGAADARDDGRAIRLMVCAGALLPEHYLGEGGNANRATAAEMGLPAIKRFQRRQEFFRTLLSRIIGRVLDEAQRVGRLGPRTNRRFVVQFEELSAAPVETVSAAVAELTGALAQASEQGWVTPEEARRLWWRFAGQADESSEQTGVGPHPGLRPVPLPQGERGLGGEGDRLQERRKPHGPWCRGE
ncbi:MAG TPA: hypothetical protein VGW38_07265 [Chloroflexota bacterium]|nr:hypothetical protein [Chloroflexota bacterium]